MVPKMISEMVHNWFKFASEIIQIAFQHEVKMEKTLPEIDQKLHAFEDRLGMRIDEFSKGKWKHVDPQINENPMSIAKSDLLEKLSFFRNNQHAVGSIGRN